MSFDEIPMPRQIERLPRNHAGYPVPWFVATIDGVPDFRVIRPGGVRTALLRQLCWICGGIRVGPVATFVIGPMCAVNRVSAEPPSHHACAVYAARACPFLANPAKRRREHGLPDETAKPAGEMLARNPGVALVWTSDDWTVRQVGDGVLFDVGDPRDVTWYAESREATRAEVVESIESGLPILREMAESESAAAVAQLDAMAARAMTLVPA